MTIDELIRELEQEADATRRVLERIPEDRMSWRPHAKSLALGQLAMHVATIPGALADISLRSFDVQTEIPRPSAASTAELLDVLAHSVDEAVATFRAMGDDGLAEVWRLVDGGAEIARMPRGDFLRHSMLNHWYHHRGQLTVYLRLLDVPVPATYGDSADETLIPA